MWAKIKELSGDKVMPSATKPTITPGPVPVADTPIKEGPSTVATISVEEDTHSPTPVSIPIPPPVLSNDEKLSPEAPSVTAVTPGVVNILEDGPTDPVDTPVPMEPEAVESQTSVVAVLTKQKPSPVMPPVDETPTSTHAPKQAISVLPVTPEDGEDLERFSAEIDLDRDEPEDEEEVPPVSPLEESDEEREARLKARAEETAWKRREITDRHTDWEYQLEDLKRDRMMAFTLALYNVRRNAVKSLKMNSDVQRAINEFAADGDRYLRGAENYLKNLVKEKKQDKNALWERVVRKVKDKFAKGLNDVDKKVADWYNGNVENEEKLVGLATKAVAEFSEKAQADLGLDYAWLDDVTVDDWTRYHELMRCALIPFCYSALELLTTS